jgi:hypothetical protein
MRNIELIYIAIVGVLILVGFFTLGLYYTQDFDEDLDLVSFVTLEDLDYSTYVQEYSNETYLNNLGANIGSLGVENNGYFARKYKFPELKGCIHFEKSSYAGGGGSYNSYSSANIPFEVRYYQGVQFNKGGGDLDVKVGDREKFVVRAERTSGTSFNIFEKFEIEEIAIYDTSGKPVNPFNSFGFGGNNRNYYGDCNKMQRELDPVHTIEWVGKSFVE